MLSAALWLSSCNGLEELARTAERTFATEETDNAGVGSGTAHAERTEQPESMPGQSGQEPSGDAAVQSGQEEAQQEGQTPEQNGAAGSGAVPDAYAYSVLQSEEERQLYREILRSLQNGERETELSTLNQELLEPVFRCVLADHPEIFYVDGYTSTSYRLGSTLRKITFSGDYTLEPAGIERRRALLEEAVSAWLADMPDGSDYEKVKFLYEYLISHTEYELGCEDSQNICSVLLNGRSVCQGYAKAFQLLCQRAQIPALLVTGTVNGQGHAWTMISVDGAWYYVDPTWGDASYRQEETGYPQSAYPAVNYDYFCVTTEQIERTHVIESGQRLPECTAVSAQYYRREGLYLERADLELIAGIFARAVQAGAGVVTFQCADDAVYEEVYRLLIEEQKVFDYLPEPEGRAAYADSPVQRTFSFWLA